MKGERKKEEETASWKSWRVKGAQSHLSQKPLLPLLPPLGAREQPLGYFSCSFVLFNVPPAVGAAV